MAKINIKECAYITYQRTTWQGEVEIKGKTITYRYSEDGNGAELYVYTENNWQEVDVTEDNYAILYAAIIEWGNPEELGTDGDIIDIDDEIVNEYL
jgi:hypothetical protein